MTKRTKALDLLPLNCWFVFIYHIPSDFSPFHCDFFPNFFDVSWHMSSSVPLVIPITLLWTLSNVNFSPTGKLKADLFFLAWWLSSVLAVSCFVYCCPPFSAPITVPSSLSIVQLLNLSSSPVNRCHSLNISYHALFQWFLLTFTPCTILLNPTSRI